MITQNLKIKKGYKLFLDLLSILSILSLIIILFLLFGGIIPLIDSTAMPAFIILLYSILILEFARITKKYKWILLNSFALIGSLIQYIIKWPYVHHYVNKFGEMSNFIKYSSLANAPLLIQIINYLGITLFLIGSAFSIIFYFLYYRKYLCGKLSLKELGIKESISEKISREKLSKKDKKDWIGWAIVIIYYSLFL